MRSCRENVGQVADRPGRPDRDTGGDGRLFLVGVSGACVDRRRSVWRGVGDGSGSRLPDLTALGDPHVRAGGL